MFSPLFLKKNDRSSVCTLFSRFCCILNVPHTALYCNFGVNIYAATAVGALPYPCDNHCFWKGRRLPGASPVTAESVLWPQGVPGLCVAVLVNATELTPQKGPLANDRQWLINTPISFPLGGTTQRHVLCHLPETPKWDWDAVAHCSHLFINVFSNGFLFLPSFPCLPSWVLLGITS